MEWSIAEFARHISETVGICDCKFFLVANGNTIHVGGFVDEIFDDMGTQNVVQLIRKVVPPLPFHGLAMEQAGYCLKCMREEGVTAEEYIEYRYDRGRDLDIETLRDAGFTLTELLEARRNLSRRHGPWPPLGCPNLGYESFAGAMYNSELQEAGYSAIDWRNAGIPATTLSRYHHKYIVEHTPGCRFPCNCHPRPEFMTFFEATDLRAAGYTLKELRDAKFPEEELVEAGYSEETPEESHREGGEGRASFVCLLSDSASMKPEMTSSNLNTSVPETGRTDSGGVPGVKRKRGASESGDEQIGTCQRSRDEE